LIIFGNNNNNNYYYFDISFIVAVNQINSGMMSSMWRRLIHGGPKLAELL